MDQSKIRIHNHLLNRGQEMQKRGWRPEPGSWLEWALAAAHNREAITHSFEEWLDNILAINEIPDVVPTEQEVLQKIDALKGELASWLKNYYLLATAWKKTAQTKTDIKSCPCGERH